MWFQMPWITLRFIKARRITPEKLRKVVCAVPKDDIRYFFLTNNLTASAETTALCYMGPQGCGKTLIAEKAAQESGLKYKIVNPSELG